MSSYRCPLIVVGVGTGFVLVGSVPVAVSYSIGVRSSATMIGMGFIGFGFLLLAPGLVWCIAIRTLHGFKRWRRRSLHGHAQSAGAAGSAAHDDVETARIDGGNSAHEKLGGSMGQRESGGLSIDCDKDADENHCNGDPSSVRRSGSRQQRRNRSWPSSYSEPPNLIVTDCHIVCNASSPPQPVPLPTNDESASNNDVIATLGDVTACAPTCDDACPTSRSVCSDVARDDVTVVTVTETEDVDGQRLIDKTTEGGTENELCEVER